MSKIHLIGNAHLDPVWLWRWQEGFAEVIATYKSALDRMKEFPDFKFTAACSFYYEWIEKTNPEMLEEIKERVKEGRWSVVGGMPIQPDCNMPDGESFARHLLLGQRYIRDTFGFTVKTAYNVDSFGHNASLPKIFNAAGIDNYVFMRPGSHEKPELTHSVFNWQSNDGSTVSTFRIPFARYCIISECIDLIGKIKEMADNDNVDYMAFYGVGNHGGGPTIKLLKEIHELDIDGLVFSTPDEYFDSLDKSALPLVSEELQHHARGCYSACSYVKKQNRKCEQNLLAAEKLCMLAKELCGFEYPQEKLRKAWKNLLFNQFHDILCGCAIKSAYTDAGYLFGETMSITEQAINKALTVISGSIDTLRGETLPSYKEQAGWNMWEHERLGMPIIIFNPHPWQFSGTVEIYASGSKVTDSSDKEIPIQIVRGEMTNGAVSYMTAFNATVPAYGYEVYRLFREEKGDTFHSSLKITETTLENEKIKVEFSRETGDICLFLDKESGKRIIDSPCRAVLLDETEYDTWAHDTDSLGEVCAVFGKPEFKVLESGCVRATLRVTVRHGESIIRRDYVITPDSSVLTVKTRTQIRDKHRTLKLTFPTSGCPVLTRIPYGIVERPQGTGEEPCGAWLSSGSLCVANDSKYGYDTYDGEVRLTVLRTAIYADHYGQSMRDDFNDYMDTDTTEFVYSLSPFTYFEAAERVASELNFGLRSINGHFHDGTLPEKMSCATINDDGIIITAIKKNEDGDGTVVRLFDIKGEDRTVSLEILGKQISVFIKKNSVKTILVDKDTVCELNLCEM